MSGGKDPGDRIRLVLDYRHGRGALAPYFQALEQGRALASRDPRSGQVSFPPRPGDGETLFLSGRGRVAAITRGPAVLPLRDEVLSCCFALVAMDGAHNLAFARVLDPAGAVGVGDPVRLAVAAGPAPHPAQCACFVPDDQTTGDPG